MSGAMGFVKRAVPFFIALIIGVFITSFFVDLSRPRFQGFRARGWERFQECKRMRMELEDLRNENLRLRNQLDTKASAEHRHPDFDPTFDEMPAPPPPPVPASPKYKVRVVR